MDLKDFIKTALVDIVQGIDEARSELDSKANYICPIFSILDAPKTSIRGVYYQEAEFDIAVSSGK
jgi:hypothetical protein